MKINLHLQALAEKKKENLITAIYAGVVLILLAAIYYAYLPNNLWSNIVEFFGSFTLASIPGAASVSLPAPLTPHAFVSLYSIVFEFALGLGILEICILGLRIYLQSPVGRKAETVSNVVFWLGASYLIIAYLVRITIMPEWFMFWAAIILLGGVSLLVRAFIILAKDFKLPPKIHNLFKHVP